MAPTLRRAAWQDYKPRMKKISVALVGGGAMGGALLRGWLAAGVIEPASSSVFEPNAGTALKSLLKDHRVALNPDPAVLQVDAIVLAVKPQAAEQALPPFAAAASRALSISVMAGVGLSKIGRLLGSNRLIRAMPNLPTQIGAGVSGLFAPEGVGEADRTMAEGLLGAAGATVFVRSEAEIDLVTAVSGSGPAYFFLLTEALAEAGASLGLEKGAARRLARATATGAGALLAADPREADELRRAVTSPGGTTEAALQQLDGSDQPLRQLVNKAVAAAAKRASQLAE
jgi:pyrroline-5-carboxylate reductase